nr:MAG TPA: hypothetical protein [Caudoviricetes sp.]
MNVVTKTLINRSTINQIVRCNAHAGRASWIKHPRSKVLAAAMLREEDQQAAQIPFDGVYESSISAVFDDAVNSELDRYKNEGGCGLTDEELEDCARGCTISKADAAEIARAWVECYEDYLTDAANDLADEDDQQDRICLRFVSYNAEANPRGYWVWGDEERPVAYISKTDLRRLRRLAAQAPAGYCEDICEACDFAGYVRKRFTPASGWVPFYSADVHEWGPVTAWNVAQIGVLLDFICPDRRLTEYGLGDRLTEEIDTLASAALSKRITAYCCEDAV